MLVAENEHEIVARIAPGGAITTWPAPGVVGVAVAPDGSVLAIDEHANVVRRTTARRRAARQPRRRRRARRRSRASA